jgi:hypothetical protein
MAQSLLTGHILGHGQLIGTLEMDNRCKVLDKAWAGGYSFGGFDGAGMSRNRTSLTEMESRLSGLRIASFRNIQRIKTVRI